MGNGAQRAALSAAGRAATINRGSTDPIDPAATLTRTMAGRIISWSPEMEQRYGFTAERALGRSAHDLLRTAFPRALREIEATLVEQSIWSGALIHRRADGSPVMSFDRWYLRRQEGGRDLVTEEHSDLFGEGALALPQVADVVAIIAHGLSEALTALGNYQAVAQRLAASDSPNSAELRRVIAGIQDQATRSAESVHELRRLAELVRRAK